MSELAALLRTFELEPVGEGRYRAVNAAVGPGVVFGGQLIAQSMLAAGRDHLDKVVKTVHTVFARGAAFDLDLDIEVEVMQAGRTFGSSTVTIRQDGRLCVRSVVLLPLVLPPVVGGIALLYTFGRRGLLGEELDALGIQIAFSTTAVVLAQTFVSLPFLVVSLEGALRSAGSRYEEVAASLGARPTTVFRRVTLPLVLPGLVSGAVLSFARALGEFGATITFAGSLEGTTRTLPLFIYNLRVVDPDAAVAMSLVLVAVAVLVIAFARPGRSTW